MSEKQYVGITIGPIFDAISEATKPAALWFASTMFSDLSRRLCFSIQDVFSKDKNMDLKIYSPFLDCADINGLQDGVGKYHDRIIFSVKESKENIKKELNQIIDREKGETINIFPVEIFSMKNGELSNDYEKNKKYLKEYLQINYVILNQKDIPEEEFEKGCLLFLSPYLDGLELMCQMPIDNENNPILRMFFGVGDKSNSYIMKSKLMLNTAKKNLCEPDLGHPESYKGIRSIESICGFIEKSKLKHEKYFAVVNADGDFMGHFLNQLKEENGEVSQFSECCFEYNKYAVNEIVNFGGLPIYAGGDDLLFLAPIMHGEESIFSLCNMIANEFQNKLSCDDKLKKYTLPSISFGVSIQYYKYPLYEALKSARELLGYYSKNKNWNEPITKEEEDKLSDEEKEARKRNMKNCICARLIKHSGQTSEFIVGNEDVNVLMRILKTVISYSGKEAEYMLRGIGATLQQFYHLITQIDVRFVENNLTIKQLVEDRKPLPWKNIFDNEGQAASGNFLKEIQDIYYTELIHNKKKLEALDIADEYHTNKQLNALLNVLRFGKFLIEKGER